MVNIVKTAYDLYKKDIISGILFSLTAMVIGFLLVIIPIIGAIIYSYVFPRLLTWYYQKLSGEKLNPNYKVSFISVFIPSLLVSIGVSMFLFLLILGMVSLSPFPLLYYYGSILNNSYMLFVYLFIISLIIIFVGVVIYLLSMYSFYGSLFNKVDKYKLDFWNSIEIFSYYLSIGIIVGFIFDIIDLIFSLMSPIVGLILGFIFLLFMGIEIQYLVPMVVAKNM